jgi:hypothetical protein
MSLIVLMSTLQTNVVPACRPGSARQKQRDQRKGHHALPSTRKLLFHGMPSTLLGSHSERAMVRCVASNMQHPKSIVCREEDRFCVEKKRLLSTHVIPVAKAVSAELSKRKFTRLLAGKDVGWKLLASALALTPRPSASAPLRVEADFRMASLYFSAFSCWEVGRMNRNTFSGSRGS